jgi:hypothetical protein
MGMTVSTVWPRLSLEERADRAEQRGAHTLYYCPDAWAVRHSWTNVQTGEVQNARCNKWECPYCGPRKVMLWRRLVCEAQPTLFLTLSKAGKTMAEARRALTTFMQALRRGSKGRGRNHVGARPAYAVEYFAVAEPHKDFERNGFHWHLLISGVEYLPFEMLRELWMSATHYDETTGQGAKIVYIKQVRDGKRGAGYVTKYLLKAVSSQQQGMKQVQRERLVKVAGEDSAIRIEKRVMVEEVTARPHRIAYSRRFFPESVVDLRKRLFAAVETEEEGQAVSSMAADGDEEEGGAQRSSWRLMERGGITEDELRAYRRERLVEVIDELGGLVEVSAEGYERLRKEAVREVEEEIKAVRRGEYRRLARERLLEALQEIDEGRYFISHGVINMWDYQRKQRRWRLVA